MMQDFMADSSDIDNCQKPTWASFGKNVRYSSFKVAIWLAARDLES
jgi:hypothetical protein